MQPASLMEKELCVTELIVGACFSLCLMLGLLIFHEGDVRALLVKWWSEAPTFPSSKPQKKKPE